MQGAALTTSNSQQRHHADGYQAKRHHDERHGYKNYMRRNRLFKMFFERKICLNHSVAGACLARELIQQVSEQRNRTRLNFKGVQGYTGIYNGKQGYTRVYRDIYAISFGVRGKMISIRINNFRDPFPLLS